MYRFGEMLHLRAADRSCRTDEVSTDRLEKTGNNRHIGWGTASLSSQHRHSGISLPVTDGHSMFTDYLNDGLHHE